MENSTPISAFIIKSKQYKKIVLTCLTGGIIALMFLALALHSPLILAGLVIFLTIPVIFADQIRKPFSKRIEFIFYADKFSVTLFNINTGEKEAENIYKFNEIESFTTSGSSRNDSKELTLYLTDDSKIKYAFYGQVDRNNMNIIDLFFDYIKAYNNAHPGSGVTIHPSYFATRSSRSTVIIVSVLIAVFITIVAFLIPEIISLPLGVAGFFYAALLGSVLSYRRQMKALGLRQ